MQSISCCRLSAFQYSSFVASIVILSILARCKDSSPLNYALLCAWSAAAVLNIGFSLMIILRNYQIRCEQQTSEFPVAGTSECSKQVCITFESYNNEPNHHTEDAEENQITFQSSNNELNHHTEENQIRQSFMLITKVAIFSIALSAALICIAFDYGPIILELEFKYSYLRSTCLLGWIYVGVVNTFPLAERQHG